MGIVTREDLSTLIFGKPMHLLQNRFQDDGEVYIVPLNFGYETKDNACVFYFHGAKEGRKIDLIRQNPNVGFEMDTVLAVYAMNESELACNYTARFQSIKDSQCSHGF